MTTGEELRALALGNYGHFTSMQVRKGAVRGLDLHLQRLQEATQALFSAELDMADLRRRMRSELAAFGSEASLRVTVFAPQFDFRHPERAVDPLALVTLAPPREGIAAAMRVRSVAFQRELPQFKHVGTFALFHHRRLARLAGFDDAVFVDAQRRISEGSLWNLGFWDGRGVVWPQAPALRGVTERLLQAGLDRAGIPQASRPVELGELSAFSGAFTCNASVVAPLRGIDGVEFPGASECAALLAELLESQPWQEI